MDITLTQAAANHIRKSLEKRGKGIGLRIGIKTSGCSGNAYVIEFADAFDSSDTVYYIDGVKVIVDPESLVFLKGTEIDYVKEGLNEGLKLNNPNVKNSCGCGESFSV